MVGSARIRFSLGSVGNYNINPFCCVVEKGVEVYCLEKDRKTAIIHEKNMKITVDTFTLTFEI